MGNVELFELCVHRAAIFTNEDWMLSQSRTTSSEREWCSARQNWTQKQHFLAHNARTRCIKKNFGGINDHVQQDSAHRYSQVKIGWTELALGQKCIDETPNRLPRNNRKNELSPHDLNKSLFINTSGGIRFRLPPVRHGGSECWSVWVTLTRDIFSCMHTCFRI